MALTIYCHAIHLAPAEHARNSCSSMLKLYLHDSVFFDPWDYQSADILNAIYSLVTLNMILKLKNNFVH